MCNQQWLQSAYAESVLRQEAIIVRAMLKQLSGPNILQIGQALEEDLLPQLNFPQLLRIDENQGANIGLQADPAHLPFREKSFANVVLPHVLEQNGSPHQVLREAHRVLNSEGQLLIIGFNPLSIIGLQKWLQRKACLKGHYYRSHRVIDWLQLLGFDIVASSMLHYAPISASERLQRWFQPINKIGDRWMPMLGGCYILLARKKEIGIRLVGKVQFDARKRPPVTATAPARVSCKLGRPLNDSA